MTKTDRVQFVPGLPSRPASPKSFNVSKPLKKSPRITLSDFAKEPFRIFFPAGVLAGIVGVALWPLYFWGIAEFYPGQIHARIMACGLFGGFIFGFLGTAMPRMLSANPLRVGEVFTLLLLYAATMMAFAMGKMFPGDVLFLTTLALFLTCMGIRASKRKDTPPPGFALVGLALLSVIAGAVLAVVQNFQEEMDPFWITLQRLLMYQGFVLLPILGIGPFILPRFFGMPNKHDFPEMLKPSKDWLKKALFALGIGIVILGSFVMEAKGWHRFAHGIRFAATLVYLFFEMPFHRAPKASNALGMAIRLAFLGVLAGFIAVAFFPVYRITLLHLTLVGGFAIVTFVVATRVVFGHSGNIALLKGRNRWLLVAVGMMLFGMATRMSGDFWPKVMQSHYIYGAILWIAGVLLWSVYVLPKVLKADTED
jgi:uncharacterized protein involved in response to NO